MAVSFFTVSPGIRKASEPLAFFFNSNIPLLLIFRIFRGSRLVTTLTFLPMSYSGEKLSEIPDTISVHLRSDVYLQFQKAIGFGYFFCF